MTERRFGAADREFARYVFAHVATETADAGGGVTRASYSLGETSALEAVAVHAGALGLRPRVDGAGNLFVTRDGAWPDEAVVIGSHLDSVPNGGNYDGLAGVVAGLLVLDRARRDGRGESLVLLGLRGEESAWFGIPHVGAKALLGKLPSRDLQRRRRPAPGVDDATLATCMVRCELGGSRSPPSIREFWELHIEQGPVLETAGVPLGVVTAIRGSARATDARVTGKAGHSGTTPHALREDAVIRFADLVHQLEVQRQRIVEQGQDLVFTIGCVSTDPARHGLTTIADLVRFTLDVRSADPGVAEDFCRHARRPNGCNPGWSPHLDLGDLVVTPGAVLSGDLVERAVRAAVGVGVDAPRMVSGAGHDAAVFAQAGIPTGMIFVRNQHGSHNPAESMDLDDFLLGVEALYVAAVESVP